MEIKIKIKIELRNTSSFLGLYSRLRSRLHQSTDEARSAQVQPHKKPHGKGTNTQITQKQTTHKQTLWLRDPLGPEGRVGEKFTNKWVVVN